MRSEKDFTKIADSEVHKQQLQCEMWLKHIMNSN